MSNISVFEKIANDIGVKRYAGEEELSFCVRCAYSASRFWTSAFCMDDGQNGKAGLTKQALSIRLRRWIMALDSIMPGVAEWFDLENHGTRTLYGRLIDIGDILPTGEEGRCFARTKLIEPFDEAGALVLGFFEPATQGVQRGGRTIVTSGLASFLPGSFETVEHYAPWWETDLGFMSWVPSADYGELQYLDPRTTRWGLSRPDAWVEHDDVDMPLALARQNDACIKVSRYFAIRGPARRRLASEIDRGQAQALMLRLKKESGHPACVTFKSLDWKHRKAYIPISVLSPQISATVDALSWPIDSISGGNGYRIFRMETVEAIKRLLRRYDIDAAEAGVKG